VLYRLLKRHYPKVTYVRNITDVEDKIIDAARAKGEAIDALTARTTRAFHEDMAALGALPPDVEPRATRHIPEMISLITALIDSGHAYEAEGHVLFDVASWPEYGALSRHKREDIIAGARVEIAPYKKDPADFVLWKPSTADQPGWDSPWGRGRPGWHIECSAMSAAHLGETFDIHGGGQDLIFPHHENEIAQSVCGHHGAPFVRVWMHNGHVIVEGEKMSKSLGNFFTVREVLAEGWPGEAIRLALLSTQYRQPLDFTRTGLAEAKAELDRFYTALRRVGDIEPSGEPAPDDVLRALDDDLNTPAAMAQIHEVVSRLNQATAPAEQAALKSALLDAAGLLGLLGQDPEAWFKGGMDETKAEIEALIARREAARKDRNFAEADRIRDALAAMGVALEDGPEGTRWKRAG